MRPSQRLSLLLSLLLLPGLAGAAPSSVEASHVTVSLVAEHAAVAPGGATTLGLHFDLEPGWHIYWQNPGESGEPPKVKAWRLPPGAEAGALGWPVPKRVPMGPIMNYGYEGEVVLTAPLTVGPDWPAEATVEADVTWLVCKEDCIPGKATVGLTLPAAAAPQPDPRWAPVFAAAREATPAEAPATLARDGEGLRITLPTLDPPADAAIDFLPTVEGVVSPSAPVTVDRREDGGVALGLTLAPTAPETLDALPGLVVVGQGSDRRALRVNAVPEGVAPVDSARAPPPPSDAPTSVAWAVLLAFLGGLILNLMPCVFPVLSLKIIGFVQQSGEQAAKIRAHGWAFAGGVLVSFWLLGGALVALRAGGDRLGWGFQLQSPLFVAVLALLVFALGLALSGLFEVGLALTSVGGSKRFEGLGGSFATGVLATVVATPCTAPFMGPALGYGLTQPPAAAMAVFSGLGLGMAFPYLVLSHAPALLRRLPRPGAWMETFKQAMAFPLFATAVWLLDVFARQAGADAAFRLGLAFVGVGFAAWLWGRGQRTGAVGAARGLVVAAALGLSAWGALTDLDEARPATAAGDGFWQPWSPDAVAAERRAGRAVFVNFTAAWCISCQVNERVVFRDDDVRAAFRDADVVALKADWTHRDATIADALAEHGREGVPLYLYYPPDPAAPAQVLPPVLTPAMVRDALAGR